MISHSGGHDLEVARIRKTCQRGLESKDRILNRMLNGKLAAGNVIDRPDDRPSDINKVIETKGNKRYDISSDGIPFCPRTRTCESPQIDNLRDFI